MSRRLTKFNLYVTNYYKLPYPRYPKLVYRVKSIQLMSQCYPITQLIQQIGVVEHTPIQQLDTAWTRDANISLSIKRDDLIHPIISGNKWRKLKYQLNDIINSPKKGIVSFGGGYSNHLHALAFCCQQLDLECICIVRGVYPTPTPMLEDIVSWGAKIEYVTKDEYKQRDNAHYLQMIQKRYPDYVLVPEGGSNYFGMEGINDLAQQIPHDIDTVIVPVGSGGTMAGLVRSLPIHQHVLGIAVLKGEHYLEDLVKQFLDNAQQNRLTWSINHQAHCGGYAKRNEELMALCTQFEQETGVPIEPVYSGKCLLGIKQLCEQGYFKRGSQILMIHTGGLQGAR